MGIGKGKKARKGEGSARLTNWFRGMEIHELEIDEKTRRNTKLIPQVAPRR